MPSFITTTGNALPTGSIACLSSNISNAIPAQDSNWFVVHFGDSHPLQQGLRGGFFSAGYYTATPYSHALRHSGYSLGDNDYAPLVTGSQWKGAIRNRPEAPGKGRFLFASSNFIIQYYETSNQLITTPVMAG